MEREVHKYTQREDGLMKMEAEIGVMQLHAKECQSNSYHPVVGRDIKKMCVTHTHKRNNRRVILKTLY